MGWCAKFCNQTVKCMQCTLISHQYCCSSIYVDSSWFFAVLIFSLQNNVLFIQHCWLKQCQNTSSTYIHMHLWYQSNVLMLMYSMAIHVHMLLVQKIDSINCQFICSLALSASRYASCIMHHLNFALCLWYIPWSLYQYLYHHIYNKFYVTPLMYTMISFDIKVITRKIWRFVC